MPRQKKKAKPKPLGVNIERLREDGGFDRALRALIQRHKGKLAVRSAADVPLRKTKPPTVRTGIPSGTHPKSAKVKALRKKVYGAGRKKKK